MMSSAVVLESCIAKLGRCLCLAGAGLGATGLVGWLAGIQPLVTIVPGQPPMMPNTAVALLLLGIAAAWPHVKHPGRATRLLPLLAAVIVLAIGLGTIAEYALDLPFSIDQLLVRGEAGPYPGCPSPPTALALACLAAAILFWEWRPAERVRPSEWLILCAGLIAFTALLGQALGVGALYQLIRTPLVGVAVHTALSLLMISAGLLLQRPDAGIMRVATSSGPGGVLLRRLAPAFILIAVSIGFTGSWLIEIVGSENGAILHASLVVLGIAAVLPLFVITARQLDRAHDALEQTRRRARDLIEQASDGIFIADLEGRYTEVNDAGCRMLGYSREEILGKTIMDLIPREEELRLRSDRELFLRGGSDVGEWTLLKKNGTYLPVEISAKILPDGRWQAFVRDISERKRAEAALRQAEGRLELALRGADLALWDWNVSTGEVILNPRWAEMRGYRPEEVESHVNSWIAGVHPGDWPRVHKVLEDYFEGVLPEFECEYRVSTKGGEWIWVLDRGKVFGRDARGQPTRMVGTVLDITARKRAEEALRQEREHFDLALRGADLATWDWNVKTGEVIFNPRWAEMRGFRPEEIKPHVDSCFAGIHPDDRPAVENVLNECLAGVRAEFEAEYRVSTKSGEWVWVLDRGKVFARDERGRPTRMVGTELDTTTRKHAEESLRQVQERLELALKGADMATWDWNIATGEVIASPRCAEMRGFRPEEINPHVDAYLAGIHPDDLSAFQSALGDCLEGIRPEFECEYRATTKTGDWVWILSQGKLFGRDERGRPIRMVGTALDVTARKRAEEALRLSEVKFAGIVSISADAVISIDEEQRITLFNESAEKVFGRSSAEMIGAPLDILVPERLRAKHRRGVENFAAGPDVTRRLGRRDAVILGVRKNGEEFPADAAISKIVVGGKRILTVALRDITEQKQAETEDRLLAEMGAALSQTVEFEARLTNLARLLARDLADLCILDIIENNGVIRRARVACRDATTEWLCDVLMRTQADGKRSRVAGPGFENGQGGLIAKVTPDVIRSWTRTDEDAAALQKAGIRSAIAVPLIARGKALGTVSLLSLSRVYRPGDLRAAEAIAQRASLLLENAHLFDSAKRAIKARDDILGIVAHDLRNPLTAIAALGAVLRLRDTKREVGEEIGEEIGNAVNRMTRLIQDLLDVTSIEAGLSLRQARLAAAEVISDSLEAQKPLASSTSLELRLDVAPDLPNIWADRDRLLQVFENLIGNAIKFTKAHGQITLGAAAHAGEVLFSVVDTGSGIASSDLPHVFDRFWRAPENKRRGAGLGLAIVKGIVEAHGGRIWVQSSPGQGSTFFFTIPTAPQAAPSYGAPALERQDG